MIIEVLGLGTAALALLALLGGGDDDKPEIDDAKRDALWAALCAQWKNGYEAPAATDNAMAAVGLDPTSQAAANLAAELWQSLRSRAPNRQTCPLAPWTKPVVVVVSTGELPKPDPKPGGPKPSGGVVFPPPGTSKAVATYKSYRDRAPGPDSLLRVTGDMDGGQSEVARMVVDALGADQTGTNRTTVMKAIALSKWNFPYRMPREKAYWTASDGALVWDVRGAFYPANEDVDVAIAQGRLPERTLAWKESVQKTGPGSSYGTLYVPDFAVFDGKVIPPSNDDEAAAGMVPDALLADLGLTPEDIVP